MTIALPRTATYFVLGILTQSWILTSITPTLLLGVLLYGLANAALTVWLYRPIIRLSFDATMTEADLRFGILHIRNYAETIALYRGEHAEGASVDTRLKRVLRVALATLRYDFIMRTTQTGIGLVWTLLPVLILVPLYFSGEITFGKITEATASAALLLEAINRLTEFIPTFAAAAPSVVRLAQITEKAQNAEREATGSQGMIRFRHGPNIQIDRLTLQTPGQERTLLQDISLVLTPPDHLLIMGQTGVGKSSLLRAMAGLWRTGSGTITMPDASEVLFLPQRPYMLLGSLREQILYPATERAFSDQALQAFLEQVSLPDIAARHGGFDSLIDWSRVLSLGEQQRIGFARALASNELW